MLSWAAPWWWAAPWSWSPSWSWSPEREELLHQPGVVLWRTHRMDRPNAARMWRPMLMLRSWPPTNDDRLRRPHPPPRPLGPRLPLQPSRPFSSGSSFFCASFSCASLSGDGNRSSPGTPLAERGTRVDAGDLRHCSYFTVAVASRRGRERFVTTDCSRSGNAKCPEDHDDDVSGVHTSPRMGTAQASEGSERQPKNVPPSAMNATSKVGH